MTQSKLERIVFHGHPAYRLTAGDLAATFLPGLGMLCASLTHRGEEMLGRGEDFDKYVQQGSTMGIPFLYPWANRLDGFRYAAAGKSVELDKSSPQLHLDGNGLPMHGVPGAKLEWSVRDESADGTKAVLRAGLAWRSAARFALFPFTHSLEIAEVLTPDTLTVTTTVRPDVGVAMPVSFGFHPYFRLPGVPRREWTLELPALRRLTVDARQIPTGEETDFSWKPQPLGERSFDDPFRCLEPQARFAISAGGRRLTVEFLEGYPFAQIYAPAGRDFIAIEPMTAPGNALNSGCPVTAAGESFVASFRIAFG